MPVDQVLTERLLAGIYDLPHVRASCLQDSSDCKAYRQLFWEMLRPLWVS